MNRIYEKFNGTTIAQVTFEDCIQVVSQAVISKHPLLQRVYLRDGDGGFHEVEQIDLFDDRFRCFDGYFDYYDYCNDGRLYMEVAE